MANNGLNLPPTIFKGSSKLSQVLYVLVDQHRKDTKDDLNNLGKKIEKYNKYAIGVLLSIVSLLIVELLKYWRG